LKNREVWIGLGFAALIEINGEICVLSLIEGVTDVKAAEEARKAEVALLNLGRKLIQAHDVERAELSRELHDYVEHLVLLSIDLDRFRQKPHESVDTGTRRDIDAAIQRVEDLVIDIQALSHRLHSSKLEYLGLATAAAAFCQELSDQKRVAIEFASEGIRKDLPHDIQLCLFHVLKETVQNAMNHSGSHGVQVLLKGGPDELNLTVRDSGVGFDAEDALRGPGIGLAALKERLTLVAGELSIESQRGRGTTIRARVPTSRQIGFPETAA
jgi:signal transduction histidine kinase